MNNNLQYVIIAILMYFATIGTSFVGEILTCDKQKLLKNKWVQHLMGLITVYIFILFSKDDLNFNPLRIMLHTMITYMLFILLNRTEYPYGIICIVILFVVFNISKYIDFIKDKKPNRKSRIKILKKINKILKISLVSIFIYGIYKGITGRGDKDILEYIFGLNKCNI